MISTVDFFGRLSTDMELRSLQWELLKLSGIVKSVNLQEILPQNNEAWSMILVPRSRMYEGFCVSAKTKWLSALVDFNCAACQVDVC